MTDALLQIGTEQKKMKQMNPNFPEQIISLDWLIQIHMFPHEFMIDRNSTSKLKKPGTPQVGIAHATKTTYGRTLDVLKKLIFFVKN